MAGVNGPDAMWSEELPPSRGQYRSIAELAIELLGAGLPVSRYDASVLITRMKSAIVAGDGPLSSLPPVEDF